MKTIYEKPQVFTDAITTYCGGCGHGIVGKLIAELVDELKLQENGILVWPIGCSCLSDRYYDMDAFMALHGRAPAASTGIKRADPKKFVLCYQGDGDMVSEGMAEIMHAAIRSEKFTIVFINNAIYGMTGGQMAPTSLPGQVTQTSPYGRDVNTVGYPVRICELLATLDGTGYVERVAVNNVKNVRAAKKAIEKAFRNQVEGKGFSLIEVLSTCPTNWGKTPQGALDWLQDNMIPYYPLGVFKDKFGEEAAK
jgi:2-oxoglutarate ferredoxin oxidoreductase subunit beta